MAIAAFPHTYTVTLAGGELAAPPRAPIAAGTPPQFGGTDRVWSPEELLAGAALLCLQTTYDAMARRDGIAEIGWHGAAIAILDKTPDGIAFTKIRLDVHVTTAAGDEHRVEATLRAAERRCIVARALRVPIELTLGIRAASTGL